MSILHGDAQFWNNLFVQQSISEEYTAYINSIGKNQLYGMNLIVGTLPYQGFPTESEYLSQFTPERIAGDRGIYYGHLPVKAGGNVYLNGAQTADCDIGSVTVPAPVTFAVTENGLTTNLYDFLPAVDTKCVCSYARCVSLYGDGFDSLFDDNFFDLLPGETKCIRVLPSPSSGIIYAETAYDQTVVSCQWKKEKEK